ncbi:heat shock factor 2-binding protein isoform X2 [Lepisosteus oculatus]|uniref:Heat shock transcription factor 2 binding protein n=1 Tax=Lepisosteus oculatus TaxID=7918 RepID=W5LZD5_LEPOC|nr:PREDICTED: heat shock factor 2-binding protein isoform X2 [Lepisosteus oculatus]
MSSGERKTGIEQDSRGKVCEKDEFVVLQKRDLERLTTEVMQLREFLPKVLNRGFFTMLQKSCEGELMKDKKQEEQEHLKQDCEHFRAQLETAQADCQREREEKIVLREELWSAQTQLRQQAEYCTQMGAAVCNLLWRVSSKEEVIQDILAGSRVQTFFTVAGQTLESFVKSLDGDGRPGQQDLSSDENQFVLALAGVITNIAAAACGRDFLASSSPVLLDTMMQLLEELKPGVCARLKVLILMFLYNISISVKGLKYISESPGLIPLLWSLLQDPDSGVCLHTLRLLQSIVLDEGLLPTVASELHKTLPLARVRELAASAHPSLRKVASEMLEDLGASVSQW